MPLMGSPSEVCRATRDGRDPSFKILRKLIRFDGKEAALSPIPRLVFEV